MMLLVLLAAGLCHAHDGRMTEAIIGGKGNAAPKLTLWTPGHLDELHDALLEGRPLRAQLAAVQGAEDPGKPRGAAKLSLWVPRGQEQDAALAASEWQDELSDRSAMVVREAAQDDAELNDDPVDDDDDVAMSPSWLRGARAGSSGSSGSSTPAVRSLGHFRRKRTASPAPNEASGEDASVAADSSKKVPPPPLQAKAARSHQFVTGRNEKEPPPVVREVEAGSGSGSGSSSTGGMQGQTQQRTVDKTPPSPPPTHASPIAAGSSRVGAGRDALGLRVNEIPQGPRWGSTESQNKRYSSVYEAETMRHAADHRHYTSDNYGNHNAYASSYGGSYGSGSSAAPYPVPPPQQRNAASATPRRIIYYASLPDPAPAPHLQQLQLQQQQQLSPLPGSSRVPHEYRGPPYDVNGAYSSDGRYPPPPGPPGPPNDNLFRYTIIDAEPPGPPHGGYRSNALQSPLPYRDRLPGPLGASPAPAAYPQPYRINPPPPPGPPALTGPSPTTDAGPQAASPIQYTQYDYNGIGGIPLPLPTDPMSASGARTATSSALLDAKQGLGPGLGPGLPPGVPLSDDPYRGFNPRQPAPWSMQVGTRLTVKDDGYGSASGGGGGLPPAARRFYVTSQQQPGYGDPRDFRDPRDPRDPRDHLAASYGPAPARFPRPLDRERSSSLSSTSGSGSGRSEPRNRLYR